MLDYCFNNILLESTYSDKCYAYIENVFLKYVHMTTPGLIYVLLSQFFIGHQKATKCQVPIFDNLLPMANNHLSNISLQSCPESSQLCSIQYIL